MTTDLMLRRTPQMLKKIKNCHKQKFEDEENNMQLDKEDTQRSKMNSKYVSETLVLKHPDSFICSYSFQ